MKKYSFAFIMFCLCLSACHHTNKWIYVDQNNVSGPWDGTSTNPYKTITAAVKTTKDDDNCIIVTRNGRYKETFTLKSGTSLQADEDNKNVVLDGGGASGIIKSKGNIRVDGLIFKNATTGIEFWLDKTSIESAHDRNLVSDCRFETSRGIVVLEFGSMSFPSNNKAKTAVWIFDNWFHGANNAVIVNFKGPQTGQLDLELLLANNFVSGNGSSGDGFFINLTETGSGSLKLVGWINNNLVFDKSNGISLSASNGAEAVPEIYGNTIADNIHNGVWVEATGGSSIKASLINNILVNNGLHGFSEATSNVSPPDISHNLFYKNNGGNYKPSGSNPISVPSGSNNLDELPNFKSGTFSWNGSPVSSGVKEGSFFLNQASLSNPAVNTGTASPTEPNIVLFYEGTTSVSHTADQGQRDRGFHYRK